MAKLGFNVPLANLQHDGGSTAVLRVAEGEPRAPSDITSDERTIYLDAINHAGTQSSAPAQRSGVLAASSKKRSWQLSRLRLFCGVMRYQLLLKSFAQNQPLP